MQNNYYFLRQLTQQLATKLVGLKLMACFSQEKDELVLGFAVARGKRKNYKEFYIKVILYPDFSCVYFPEQFERAKKNSADLFLPLTENEQYREVLSVQQFQNERCFAIHLEDNFSLLFKLYSNRSNVVLFQNEEVVDLFQSRIVADKQLNIRTLDRPLKQDFEAFQLENGNYKKLFPTLGKVVTHFLDEKIKPNTSLPEAWKVLMDTVEKLQNPTFYLTKITHELHLSLLPIGEIIQTFAEPMEAVNSFYVSYTKVSTLEAEKAAILKKLLKEKRQTQSYLELSYERLLNRTSEVKNEEIGHILMANLHELQAIDTAQKLERIELFDFYRNQPISIKLKPDLSPQRNAEHYYRKAKNEKIELDKLQENIESREKLLATLNENIAAIEKFESLKEFRNYLKINKLTMVVQAASTDALFKKYEQEGFEIWVGRNAKNNDLLTQHYAYKEDLWLHARDAQGSHVLVKFKAGKKFPITVIERAASLAAYFSKRRNEALAPVIVTQKKFVRKPKGFTEGKVHVEKEEVIMVEPKLE